MKQAGTIPSARTLWNTSEGVFQWLKPTLRNRASQVFGVAVTVSLFLLPSRFPEAQTQLQRSVSMAKCGLTFQAPERFTILHAAADSLEARLELKTEDSWQSYRFVLLCASNENRTNVVSEIEKKAQAGQNFRNFEPLSVHSLDGALYERRNDASPNPQFAIAAYFAGREYEYMMLLIPEFANPSASHFSTSRIALKQIAKSILFQYSPSQAITESEFRLRLYLFYALFAGLMLAFAYFLYRRFPKKKRSVDLV